MIARTHFRQPPRPPFNGVRHANGRRPCPMCGGDAGFKRGWWHRECAATWNLAAAPQIQYAELQRNAGSRCWACGRRGASEVEHIRPLWSLRGDELNDLKWWLPFNLQLLCHECHLAKSKREAAERAALRRAA